MTNTQQATLNTPEAMQIIMAEALVFYSEKSGATVDQIKEQMELGNEVVLGQMAKLVGRGVQEVATLIV